jgi:hypothetical protein
MIFNPQTMKKNIDTKEYTLLYDAVMHTKLISDFDTINKKLNFMTEISSEDFLPLNQKLRIYQKSLNALTDNTNIDQKIAASGAYGSIAELIKDMQFHDVIHQRLDHIRKINASIQKELKEVGYDPMYLSKTHYIRIITQLAKINFVQIQAINFEYSLVIENLKKSLNSINQVLNVESNTYHVYCFSNVSLFSVLTETICNKLKNISEMVYPEKNYHAPFSSEELEHISRLYTMKGERDIFDQVLELSAQNLTIDAINSTILKEFTKSASDNRFELF